MFIKCVLSKNTNSTSPKPAVPLHIRVRNSLLPLGFNAVDVQLPGYQLSVCTPDSVQSHALRAAARLGEAAAEDPPHLTCSLGLICMMSLQFKGQS